MGYIITGGYGGDGTIITGGYGGDESLSLIISAITKIDFGISKNTSTIFKSEAKTKLYTGITKSTNLVGTPTILAEEEEE